MSQSELNLALSVFQSMVILDDDSLIQVQDWNGKEITIRRKLVDEKMVVVSELFLIFSNTYIWASQVAQWVKNPPAMQEMQEMQARPLGREDCLDEGMGTHSSILAWRIPRTEEPDGLQSIGSQRVGHD